jgi:hypothetical protein
MVLPHGDHRVASTARAGTLAWLGAATLVACSGGGPAPDHPRPSERTASAAAAPLGAGQPAATSHEPAPGSCARRADCPAGARCDPRRHACWPRACAELEGERWLRRFGEGAFDGHATAIALDPDDSIVLGGSFAGKLALRTGPAPSPSFELQSAGGSDIFLARFDLHGELLWASRYGGPDADYLDAVAIGADGDIVLVGELKGEWGFGGPARPGCGEDDLFIAKLDRKGHPLWSQRFGDEKSQYHAGVAIFPAGDIVMTGFFYGTLDAGGGSLGSNDGNSFVARFRPNGRHVWSKGLGELGPMVTTVAIDPEGNIVLTGDAAGTLELDPGHPLPCKALRDVFLAKLGPDGRALWSKRFGDAPLSGQSAQGMALAEDGTITLSGAFSGGIDFGAGRMATTAREEQLFVAQFDADGQPRWAKAIGLPRAQPLRVAAGPAGGALLAGSFVEHLNLGGGEIALGLGVPDPSDPSSALPNQRTAFVGALAASGGYQWGRPWGSQGDLVEAAAVDGCGHLLVAGTNGWHRTTEIFLGRLP